MVNRCSKLRFAASTALIFFATFAAAQEGMPKIDTQKLCRTRAQTVGEQVGSRTFDTCMNSEKTAEDALRAAWKDIPPSYKAACVKPEVYSPSYAEWISCLELNIDVKILRSKK